MHYWGDEWFNAHGTEFYNAIDELEYRIRKWAKCSVCGKEKYGTYRDDFFRMWDGDLSTIIFGYKMYHSDSWIERLIYHIDWYLIPTKKAKFGWHRFGIADFNRAIGIAKLVNKWQARRVNKSFQITCKEHPKIIDELVCDTDCYKMIKPCRWGDVDGRKIHDKYWEAI